MPIEEARDRVYDLDWSNTPQTEGGQLLPPSSTIQVGPNADVYELDAEDSDNSDPEARSRRIRNLEGRTEEAGWLTWLDGERPGASQPSHPKPQLAEPASKRVRVVVTADALRGTPPITPPHVRQVIVVPKGKSMSASTADRPRVPIVEPQLSLVVDPVFVPAVSPQPPPSARDVSPPVQAPIAPPQLPSPLLSRRRGLAAHHRPWCQSIRPPRHHKHTDRPRRRVRFARGHPRPRLSLRRQKRGNCLPKPSGELSKPLRSVTDPCMWRQTARASRCRLVLACQ